MKETPFYTPDPRAAARSQMAQFQRHCEAVVGQSFEDWPAFHRWSVREFRTFWRLFLDFARPVVDGDPEPVCVGEECETATFFPRLNLNYTENVLLGGARGEKAAALTAGVPDDHLAILALDETGREARVTFGELRARVGTLANALQASGLKPGDRVAAIARNDERTIMACLAATGVGAVWASVPPDLGADATLARLGPLEPVWLFVHATSAYQGVRRAMRERVAAVVRDLRSVRGVVVLDGDLDALGDVGCRAIPFEDLQSGAARSAWPRFPFNHPLFILFSSGTTGPPKCIVHGAGGSLFEHLKEHRLHSDFGAGDVLFFQTSTGWMMWNWQLSALASGTAIVLWDGSATYPEADQLWRVVVRAGATVFGTSPAYLQYCREAGIVPRERYDLSRLRAIQSTGSILYDNLFDWIHENVARIPVQSISGGTDILGCFVLGHPGLPVWRGESQCISLGLDVREVPDPDGGPAELVCANPFPSRPIGFLNDPDRRRFHEAYFSRHPGVWTHGDFLRIHARGSVRMLGRSDGVLNVRGIRIGPAEIYAILQDFPEIRASLAVEQEDPRAPGGTRLVLLVVPSPGVAIDRPLMLRMKKALAQRASMNHVPDAIVEVPDLPVTHNGKLSERAAREAVNGRVPVNLAAIKNPQILETIRTHPGLRRQPS